MSFILTGFEQWWRLRNRYNAIYMNLYKPYIHVSIYTLYIIHVFVYVHVSIYMQVCMYKYSVCTPCMCV